MGVLVILPPIRSVLFLMPFVLLCATYFYHEDIGKSRNTGDHKDHHRDQLIRAKTDRSSFQWTPYLQFLQKNVERCDDLFEETNKKDPFPDHYKEWIALHEEFITGQFDITEGFTFPFVEETLVMLRLAELPFMRTVCETGFNAGHSTLTWMAAKPDMRLLSFDLGFHGYSRPIASWLKRLFKDRFQITWGRSETTLHAFHANRPNVTCDLIVVDGGHTYEAASADFRNFYEMASENNIVLFDNYPERNNAEFRRELGAAWKNQLHSGRLIELFNCTYETSGHGFSVGRFLK